MEKGEKKRKKKKRTMYTKFVNAIGDVYMDPPSCVYHSSLKYADEWVDNKKIFPCSIRISNAFEKLVIGYWLQIGDRYNRVESLGRIRLSWSLLPCLKLSLPCLLSGRVNDSSLAEMRWKNVINHCV
jgi:hypothetical protein